MRRGLFIVCFTAVVAGCVTADDLPPLMQLLDEQSGVTVEATGEPYVLARDAAALAANTRDYLDLRLIEVDRMGKRSFLLSLVAFSTVDRHGEPSLTTPALARVRVRLGDRVTDLEAVPEGDESRGLSTRVFPRRNGQTGSAEYVVSQPFVRDIAAAREADLSLEIGGDGDVRYEPWQPAESTLRGFVQKLLHGVG